MSRSKWVIGPVFEMAVLLCAINADAAESATTSYPAMAPMAQYLLTSPADEIALARSAAPASVSDDADVFTFSKRGYEVASKGDNGFVCMVWRSWAADFGDAEFWNPKLRAPICLNAAAARTILPGYLERTKWVLGGVSRADMLARTKAALAANTYVLPEPGAMGYMMSKRGYLSDADGHWHPHLMFFAAHVEPAAWGANLKGSPIFAARGDPEPITTFFAAVTTWSDGTPAAMEMH
ncbi:MAG: hypothetical protein ABSF94_11425 [Steroidobacteraceae bacterium]|jgi:hypothetical protein